MTHSMRERVAGILGRMTQKYGLHPNSAHPDFWMDDAGKIIAAMRDPTEAMELAAFGEVEGVAAYKAMIDEAMK